MPEAYTGESPEDSIDRLFSPGERMLNRALIAQQAAFAMPSRTPGEAKARDEAIDKANQAVSDAQANLIEGHEE